MSFKTQMCKACQVRWVQTRGHCRRCATRLGLFEQSVFERERDQVRRAEEQIARNKIPDERLQPRPAIPVVVEGQEFDVVWNGA
jgi:predicted ATP-dependent serine protease